MNALILLFYRIVAFFTRVPRETIHKHTLLFDEKFSERDITQGKYINNQGAFFDFPYGYGNVGLNGCGPIAVFNALVALNEINVINVEKKEIYNHFIKILEYFEKNGAALKGRFGTSPISIRYYLKKNGFETKAYSKKSTSKLNDFSDNYHAFISIIYNDAKDIRRGLHFICTKKNEDGTFTSHNPEYTGNSLFEALNQCSSHEVRHVYTIGIKKREAI